MVAAIAQKSRSLRLDGGLAQFRSFSLLPRALTRTGVEGGGILFLLLTYITIKHETLLAVTKEDGNGLKQIKCAKMKSEQENPETANP